MFLLWKNKQQADIIKSLETEILRLKSGDFTEEEFQNLCHKFNETDKCRFFDGCAAYQRKLFGESHIDKIVKILESLADVRPNEPSYFRLRLEARKLVYGYL